MNDGNVVFYATLILAILSCLCGCGDEGPDRIEIRWWDGPTMVGLPGKEPEPTDTAKDYQLKLAREFEAMHPEVKIEVSIYGWWEIRNKIKIALMAGDGPDIGYDEGAVLLNYARIGALEPVDDYLTEEDRHDFYPEVLRRATADGQTWYFPFDTSSPCFISVNRRIFRDRSVEHLLKSPDDPVWTFDEFIEAAKAVTFDEDGDGRIDVWGLGMQFKEEAGYGRNAILWGMGASIFNPEGRVFTLNSIEAEKGLQLLYDLEFKYKVMKPGGAALSHYDMQSAWIRGKIAMIPDLATVEEGIEQNIEDGIIEPGDIDIVAMHFPRAPGKDPKIYLTDDGVCVFRQKDAKKKDILMKLARFITNAKHQRERSPHVNMFPVRQSAGPVYQDNPWMQSIDRFRKVAANDPSCPMYVPLRRVLLPMYQSVMIGESSPAAALQEADKRARRILQKENYQ
jgi:multiple sugar transport system substrate-binding protein